MHVVLPRDEQWRRAKAGAAAAVRGGKPDAKRAAKVERRQEQLRTAVQEFDAAFEADMGSTPQELAAWQQRVGAATVAMRATARTVDGAAEAGTSRKQRQKAKQVAAQAAGAQARGDDAAATASGNSGGATSYGGTSTFLAPPSDPHRNEYAEPALAAKARRAGLVLPGLPLPLNLKCGVCEPPPWTVAGCCWARRASAPSREVRAGARWELLVAKYVPLLTVHAAAATVGGAAAARPRRSCVDRLTLAYRVLAEWTAEKEAHAPCRRYHPQGHDEYPGGWETLAPERVWDGWGWAANPGAPSAEVLAGPNVVRPYGHPAEVAARAVAAARAEQEGFEEGCGGSARDVKYERAALEAFLEEWWEGRGTGGGHVYGGSDDGDDDDYGDGGTMTDRHDDFVYEDVLRGGD